MFGFLDLAMLLLLFLPLFAAREGGTVVAVSLLTGGGVALPFKLLLVTLAVVTALFGALTLALQGCERAAWIRSRRWISLSLGASLVLLSVIGLHPYAAVFAFFLLAIKVPFLK